MYWIPYAEGCLGSWYHTLTRSVRVLYMDDQQSQWEMSYFGSASTEKPLGRFSEKKFARLITSGTPPHMQVLVSKRACLCMRENLTLPESRVIALHRRRWQCSLSSSKFSWWAPKDARVDIQCVMALQGHPRSLILAPIESAYGHQY